MSSRPAVDTRIRSFRVDMPEEAIADLRRRIAATRLLFATEIRAAFQSLR